VKFTNPALKRVMIPLLSIVATVESLDEYTITPLLKLVGYATAENGVEVYVRVELTVNAERTGVPLLIVNINVAEPVEKLVDSD
jgi:hypothetical protein